MEMTKVFLPDLTKRYDIGKKPLAKLLGWGETTVLRYLNGQAEPNGEFLRRTLELAENPWEYLHLLEYNKDKKVLTEVAYRKTQAAVLKAILCDRSTEAMQYVIFLAGGDIAPSQVLTVLYYSQLCCLMLYGRELFEEEVAIAAGAPLYPGLYDKMLRYGLHTLEEEALSLTKEEKECLKTVYESLKMYSPKTIANALARDREWLIRNRKGKGDSVSAEEMKRQYTARFEEYGIRAPGQIGLWIKPQKRRESSL